MNYEIIGTLASTIVLLSFLITGEQKIRTVNIIGAFVFVIYGVLINAFSVWFLNGALMGIHLYRLYKLKKG